MEGNTRLVEMSETETGYTINNLTPFFLHSHINEIVDKVKTGLLIYTELQRIASTDNTSIILEIIRNARGMDAAMKTLIETFNISESTAQHILNMPLEEVCRIDGFDYTSAIRIYQEAASSFAKIAEMQASIDTAKYNK